MKQQRDRLLAGRFHQRFLVTLHDGTGIGGLLVDVDEAVIVLANVVYMPRDPKAQQINVDGQLFIERSNIAYMQGL